MHTEGSKQFVLVSYDISDDKRRRKIMQTLEGFGNRVQYSVFECWLTSKQLHSMKSVLSNLVAPHDSIRLYFINQADVNRILVLGNGAVTPDSIFYLH